MDIVRQWLWMDARTTFNMEISEKRSSVTGLAFPLYGKIKVVQKTTFVRTTQSDFTCPFRVNE